MLRGTIAVAAVFVILLGSGMAVLWLSRELWPEILLPGFYYLKFNTSVAFICVGVGMFAALKKWNIVTLIISATLLLIGGITLTQYVMGRNLGFDELLLRDFYYTNNPYPGRMAPSPALAFTCAGLQLLLIATTNGWRGPWRSMSVEMLGFLVFALGAEGIIGHLQDVSYAYSWGSQARMTPHSAVGFAVLGIGLMALAWHEQHIQIARIPLWVPALLCFAVLMVDVITPRGYATGIAYVPLVFCGLWFTRPHTAFVFAGLATTLAILGFLAKPHADMDVWTALINRFIAIGAVWLVAILIYLRHSSEVALAQSKVRQSAVFNHAVDGLISINERGIVENFNPACERIFGYKATEVLGRNIKMLMPEPYHSEHDGYLRRYITTGEARIIGTPGREVSARRKDGSVFPIDLSISAFELKDGRHFSGIVRDITERKTAQAELLRYTSELERSNKELDDFAYIASHDLKEPLRGLFNNATFLREDNQGKLNAESVRRLNRIGFLSQRLEQLVDDLLYFSRLGRQEMVSQQTDLNVAIHSIEALLETTLKEQNAVIEIPRPLPSISCNKFRVMEVFRNLIINAIKYNDKPNKKIEIGCIENMQTQRGIEGQVFYVRDNGIGIEEQFYDEVFRIFKRLNEEDDSKKGTGVGLTFVRKIIHRHGGRIWVESVPGEGTTFYFTLAPGIAYAAA